MDKFSFDFTRTEYKYICDELMLDEENKKLLECKIMGLTYVKTGEVCGMSPDNVKKKIAKLRKRILKII